MLGRQRTEQGNDLCCRRVDLGPLLAPRLLYARYELSHPSSPEPRLLWDVRGREERSGVRRHYDAEGPPSLPRHCLTDFHIDVVDIRPLLAVDLDVHERVVHHSRDLGVLERLMGHNVAPVARRVPDRQKQGLVFVPCLVERFGPPRIPINGIISVLEQIQVLLGGQRISRFPIPGAFALHR